MLASAGSNRRKATEVNIAVPSWVSQYLLARHLGDDQFADPAVLHAGAQAHRRQEHEAHGWLIEIPALHRLIFQNRHELLDRHANAQLMFLAADSLGSHDDG